LISLHLPHCYLLSGVERLSKRFRKAQVLLLPTI
jgi:hypothetical protein